MNQNANAIWQFDKEETTGNDSPETISDIYTFIYENGTVTIQMLTTGAMTGLPQDNVYRIATRWQGDTLFIFPPLGNKWQLFAHWDNDRFVMYGGGKMKVFRKISPEEIAPWNKALLKPERPVWKYIYLDPQTIDL